MHSTVQTVLKKTANRIILGALAIFVLAGCADKDGNYPVYSPTTLTVTVTGPSVLEADSKNHAGRFGNFGVNVGVSFNLHPTPTRPTTAPTPKPKQN